MKNLLLTLMFFVTSACGDKSHTEKTSEFSLPEGLQDCRIYHLKSATFGGSQLTVVRCPHSNTTTHIHGKHPQTVNLIEE